MRTTILSSLVAAFVLASPVSAQEQGSAATRDYVDAAGQSDAFEMMEAITVLAQTNDPEARAFAQRMLRDHAQLSDTLRRATAEAGVDSPPTEVGADQAPFLAALQSLRGPDVDKAYWRHQALVHRSALVTTQAYAAKGDDLTIRRAAAAAVPVISAHLAMAEQMKLRAGGS